MDVLVLLVLLLIHDGLLHSGDKSSAARQPRRRLAASRRPKVFHLEAGCDGGVLVVSGLCIADEVIPAGEHLPGEGELTFVSVATANICILGHPEGSGDAVLADRHDFQSQTRRKVGSRYLGGGLFIYSFIAGAEL